MNAGHFHIPHEIVRAGRLRPLITWNERRRCMPVCANKANTIAIKSNRERAAARVKFTGEVLIAA